MLIKLFILLDKFLTRHFVESLPFDLDSVIVRLNSQVERTKKKKIIEMPIILSRFSKIAYGLP